MRIHEAHARFCIVLSCGSQKRESSKTGPEAKARVMATVKRLKAASVVSSDQEVFFISILRYSDGHFRRYKFIEFQISNISTCVGFPGCSGQQLCEQSGRGWNTGFQTRPLQKRDIKLMTSFWLTIYETL